MKILILGAGKLGTFFCDILAPDHQVAVYDTNPDKLRFTYGVERFSDLNEISGFAPDIVINAATVRYTIPAFESVLPYLPEKCILSDIASVKTGLPEFYASCGHPYASRHHHFRDIYSRLGLNIVEYTFSEHDETIAYSLSIPFASTLVFASIMKHQDAPGTTFKRHMAIARGLMGEDDYLLSEILFNPNTPRQLEQIRSQLAILQSIVEKRDSEAMAAYLASVRGNIK